MQTHRSAPRGRAAAMSILRASRDRSALPAAAPPACPPPHHCFAHQLCPFLTHSRVFPNCRSSSAAIWGSSVSPRGRCKGKGWCSLWQSRDMVCPESIPSSLVLGDIPAFFSATNSMQTQRETQLSLGLETWLCEEWKAFPL